MTLYVTLAHSPSQPCTNTNICSASSQNSRQRDLIRRSKIDSNFTPRLHGVKHGNFAYDRAG